MSVCLSIKDGFFEGLKSGAEVVENLTVPESISLAIRVASLVRFIGSTSKQMLDNARSLPFVGFLKMTSLGAVPFIIYDLGVSVFTVTQLTFNEKIDVVLSVVSSLGVLGDVIADMAEGLLAIGKVSAQSVVWATPLNIAAVVIASVGMILTTKKVMEVHCFSVLFKEKASLNKTDDEYGLEDFNCARKLIIKRQNEESSFITKNFGKAVNEEQFLGRLTAIESEAKILLSSTNSNDVLRGKHKLKSTMQTLSKRLTVNKFSGALNLLIETVGLIGFAVLFSPCPAAGFGILAVHGVVSLIDFFVGRFLTQRFLKELQI